MTLRYLPFKISDAKNIVVIFIEILVYPSASPPPPTSTLSPIHIFLTQQPDSQEVVGSGLFSIEINATLYLFACHVDWFRYFHIYVDVFVRI